MSLLDLFKKHREKLTNTFVLDMGCLFRRFAELRVSDDKPWTKIFWEELAQYTLVDYFHIKNHSPTHTYCRRYCDPRTPENRNRLGGASTTVCERTFSWLKLYSRSLNHMSPPRFYFFLLLVAEKKNRMLTKALGRDVKENEDEWIGVRCHYSVFLCEIFMKYRRIRVLDIGFHSK